MCVCVCVCVCEKERERLSLQDIGKRRESGKEEAGERERERSSWPESATWRGVVSEPTNSRDGGKRGGGV